ncbi:His-Xaa-Ser system radical SAM maturase HxsC [Geothermobacter ehrlichii]|uniref:His-Xaa-Ser system radical SAM maturase HxsC n=1 Tax=Geothermobacter ehrlichii TaxID=213224 RepID=A0A5D3WJG1_9BACT|nr:His-Xaa-Ser system radical SAM maturase HxsC [Geothermobacter ehrlichii]TYO96724.1 His-Xaa-Ser system radical SAM maturase HxsC [Geothermobacter ehrlichii]
MKQSKGTPFGLARTVLARVTTTPKSFLSRRNYVFTGDEGAYGYAACLSSNKLGPGVKGVGNLPHEFLSLDLQDNDIVLISPAGEVSVVWEAGSRQNSLLLTEACDCRCLMCPQPPKKHDPALPKIARNILAMLTPEEVEGLCLTGGEPSLLRDEFVAILEMIRIRFKDRPTVLLTNGKNFSDFEYAKRCAIAAGGQVIFCVSLHADNDRDHDRIVGVKGSFAKTVKGITNLAKLRVPIEIRFVVNRVNAGQMGRFADFVYRNFPFVVHVAFMAMEIRGLADENIDTIWIDPFDYGEQMRHAANQLALRGVPVSIYNMPLCLLPRAGWDFARQSISRWKNSLVETCAPCAVKEQCAGVFATSSRQSAYLRPVLEKIDNG